MAMQLGLRSNNSDNRSYEGFQWVKKGKIKCPDWKKNDRCGNGLHLLPKGLGDSYLLRWEENPLWLVCKYDDRYAIDLNKKIKVPSCEVIYCGNRAEATAILYKQYGNIGIHGLVYESGDLANIVGGNLSNIKVGNKSSVTVKNDSTVLGGHALKVNGGHRCYLIGQHSSILTSGRNSILIGGSNTIFNGQDGATFIHKINGKTTTCQVGYDNIKPSCCYKYDYITHNFVEVK